MQHQNGSWRWIDATASNQREEPVIHAVVVTYRDITDRKRAEEALRESEARARELMESPVDSVLLVDPDGIILDANRIFAQRMGRCVDELIGKRVYDILSPELVESRRARVDEVVQQGAPIRFEDERAGMHLDQSAFPIFGSKGNVTKIAIVARDLTASKRAEEALRESEERYRRLCGRTIQLHAYRDLRSMHVQPEFDHFDLGYRSSLGMVLYVSCIHKADRLAIFSPPVGSCHL